MIYSVSELEAYARCPMEFFLKYHREVPAQTFDVTSTLAGNILGDLVHSVIRDMLLIRGAPMNDVLNRLIQTNEIPKSTVPIDEIMTLCERAIDFHQKKSWIEFRVETPFSMKVGDSIVRGTIDFLGRDAAGWHIVDYKTDRLADKASLSEREKSYHLQMMAYAAAATLAEVTPLIDTTLLFLRLDAPVVVPVAKNAATEALAQMTRIIDGINQENWEPGKTPPCRTCPFHHNELCWKDTLRNQPA